MKTAITDMFGIQYPIIQGGLHGLGTSPLVSAVSEAGGLGLLTAGSFASKEEMLLDIERTRHLTSKPFGVNIAIGIRKPMDEYVTGVIEAEVPIVFTSGANPAEFVKPLKDNGVKLVHVVPSVKFAKKAEEIGCDAVVIVGYECGGHPGREDVTSLTLVQKAVREVSIPVIAAGGFSTGASLIAALSLGAEAVQMGTRFVATKEVVLHERIKEKLPQLTENDTMIVKRSIGKPIRVMATEHAKELKALEDKGATLEEIMPYISGEAYLESLRTGDLAKGIFSLGQTIGLIDTIASVGDTIDQVMGEARRVLKRLEHYEKL